jgi:3-oxoacyl-(acyl-carrier-protein) synthase III
MERLPSDVIVGIDLGTTNSCAALAVGDGQVKLIPYKGGDYTIPSIFAIDDKGHELIGHEAKRQWQLNPRNTLYATKRLIGRAPKDDVVESVQRSVQYRVHAGDLNDVALDCHGHSFHVPEVSAKILGKIRDVASDHLGLPVKRAVVTVPAYFNDRQRQAVKEAGTLVDLEVVRIINEPTAAALAYGIGKRLDQRVLVYDLGGGTFDVSIIEIRDRVFEVKATGGDIFLGGLDFDNAVIGYVLDDFRRKHGIDLSSDPVAMQRIKDLAERTKIDLSARTEAPFSIPFITMTAQGQPLNMDLRFDRTLLEALTHHLVDRSLEIMAGVMVDAGVGAADIDFVAVGTTTPDFVFPNVATLVQAGLGIHDCPAFSLETACSGFIYALSIADKFMRLGESRCALVIGADMLTRLVDWTDRSTCVLFADGAGAVVLKPSDEPGIITTLISADGQYKDLLQFPYGPSSGFDRLRAGAAGGITMKGNEVFKVAVNTLSKLVDQTLAKGGVDRSQIDWLVPHQANLRIIQAAAKKLDMPMERVVVTVQDHGNTSAASIPLALDVAVRDGRIRRGQLLLLETFGGGFTWGAALVRY